MENECQISEIINIIIAGLFIASEVLTFLEIEPNGVIQGLLAILRKKKKVPEISV
jgi:hypothetical protein